MNKSRKKVKLTENSFAVHRRTQRIEKVRAIINETLDAIAGIYQDDFENTGSHLDKFLEELESDSMEKVGRLFHVMGRLLIEHSERETFLGSQGKSRLDPSEKAQY